MITSRSCGIDEMKAVCWGIKFKDFIVKTLLIRLLERYLMFVLSKQRSIQISYDARVVRRKILRNENLKHSALAIGNKSWVDCSIVFEKIGANISIGSNTFISGVTISCANRIIIGNNVQIAWGVVILDHNSHSLNYLDRRNDLSDRYNHQKNWNNIAISEVVISDDAWIGLNSIILKGVRIGRGAIVGAGSVVTKNVPDMTIVAGNPARVIKLVDEVSCNEKN